MPAGRPTSQPSFDAKLFTQRLYERVRQADGKPYAILDGFDDAANTPINFTLWKQWVAKQIHDVGENHAEYIDMLITGLTKVATREAQHYTDLDNRVAAIEAQFSNTPFPG